MSERDVDALLIERVRRGERRAFDLLVIKYQRKLMRLLARMVRDPAELEDLTQEVFIKAWRALPQFRGESAFYTWLYRIAMNSARNWQSARAREPLANSVSSDPGDETFTPLDGLSDNATPESELASREIALTVNQAIEALSADLRTAIVLREIEGMSYEDIAAVMQCPVGTVRSRIYRAREAIAARLRPVMGQDIRE